MDLGGEGYVQLKVNSGDTGNDTIDKGCCEWRAHLMVLVRLKLSVKETDFWYANMTMSQLPYSINNGPYSINNGQPQSLLSSPAQQRAAWQGLPWSRDTSQGYSLRSKFLAATDYWWVIKSTLNWNLS